jgi:hypothetical protein
VGHATRRHSGLGVTGWVEPPPPPSPPSAHRHVYDVYDFSDDTIEGELVRPASARAPVIGVVTGELTGTPETGDWMRVELFTPWGHVTGHAHTKAE